MTEPDKSFGPELRRLRIEAGLSLTRLAGLLHYSKGHLSKVETGLKRPTPELARCCDALVGAAGDLAALVPPRPARGATSEAMAKQEMDGNEVWVISMVPDGSSWFRLVDRRQALVGGAASMLSFGLSGHDMSSTAQQDSSLEVFRRQFDQFRLLGQTASPAVVLPALIAQAQTIQGVAARSEARRQGPALTLAARYAEYVGWMCQEAGSDEAALWWTDRAVNLAAAGDDRYLADYALVRRALIALYRNDAAETVELSRRAQRSSVPPRIRGLAAQREAQGHALAGNYDACLRSLDTARRLLAVAQPDSATPVLGSANLADPAAMITGWCLHDLGRPRAAAEVLDREVARLPPHALRAGTRYGVRRALAHATAGEVEHACGIAGSLLGGAGVVASATIRTDLCRLARILSRFGTTRSVRELSPRLVAALHNPAA
ncbi:MAG: helix-turn-helix domain-containing protein [Pseudonocardiaceae bacterium]